MGIQWDGTFARYARVAKPGSLVINLLFVCPKDCFFAALQVKPPPRPKRGRPSVKSPLNPVPRASFKGALRKGRVDRCVSRPERDSILCAVVWTQANALVCPFSH